MSATPVIATVITFVGNSILGVGVKVAVHVVPPSPELTAVNPPLGIVRSAFVNPVIGSEKMKVTKDVSPIFKASSVKIAEVRVGGVVSASGTVIVFESVVTVVWKSKALPNKFANSVSYTHLRAHETDSYLVC